MLPASARSSFRPALKYILVLWTAAPAGAFLVSAVPEFMVPAVYIAVTAAGIAVLMKAGELQGRWLGMPAALLAAAPLAGLQILAAGYGDPAEVFVLAAGSALGFGGAYILIGSIRETSKISETSPAFKTNPVVLLSMAVFALIFSGIIL